MRNGTPLRVAVVDPDPRVRRGLRALLEAQPDMVVVGEAKTPAEAVQSAQAGHPSVILLDITVSTLQDDLPAIEALAERHQPCVVTSWDPNLRAAALESGATSFVEKGASPAILLAAIRSAARATAPGEREKRRSRSQLVG